VRPATNRASITILSGFTLLVMLLWGVASEALRDIVTRFLDEVRFE
jgi:hypothetical protein